MKRVNVILETELYDKARVVGFIRKKSLSEIVRECARGSGSEVERRRTGGARPYGEGRARAPEDPGRRRVHIP
ncbi:MAG: hypothetical protein MZV63_41270 [Marinilabiliales bacterium]|nr:hypothetical protein [Marinilabiliales bacterium]